MLKVFNISTLLLFVCFLFAPTITYAFDKDLDTYSLAISEEEETHSKNKTGSNNLNEEEEKEIHYHFFSSFLYKTAKNDFSNASLNFANCCVKNYLVFKIPLPPPEYNL